jgi:hypothetical protein
MSFIAKCIDKLVSSREVLSIDVYRFSSLHIDSMKVNRQGSKSCRIFIQANNLPFLIDSSLEQIAHWIQSNFLRVFIYVSILS